MENSQIINYLGPNSYPGIVSQIAEKLNTAKVETIAGNELISKAIQTLNESITPMMDLKEFTTNAEILAPNDAKLADIVTFIRKNVESGDLNFLANMCKEEHFKEMSRTGFPSPQDTIKEFESLFNETPSIIEQGIKNGLLDKLSSNLMMEIKSSIVDDGKTKIINDPNDVVQILNENQVLYSNNNLISYIPIGISMEDVKNNRMLLLTESDVLSFDRNTKDFDRIGNDELLELQIPDGHKRMMSAIQELAYNPEDESFSLNENWDFNMKLNKKGEIVLLNEQNNKTNILDKNDLPKFLMESINLYENQAVVPSFFNKEKYLKDADNIILLCENHNKIIKLDNLKVIRNLNENKYVVIEPKSTKKPKLIAGTGLKISQLFESYLDLNNNCNEILNKSLVGLFENQINIEKDFNSKKFENIQKLQEEQSDLNKDITETDNLLKIAEENSPAFEKLNESKEILNSKLEENILNINNYLHNHKLYL
jgi:hypothetical protein